jgi:hypothetical protein
MRFIWCRLYGLDPESGTENHSLYLQYGAVDSCGFVHPRLYSRLILQHIRISTRLNHFMVILDIGLPEAPVCGCD